MTKQLTLDGVDTGKRTQLPMDGFGVAEKTGKIKPPAKPWNGLISQKELAKPSQMTYVDVPVGGHFYNPPARRELSHAEIMEEARDLTLVMDFEAAAPSTTKHASRKDWRTFHSKNGDWAKWGGKGGKSTASNPANYRNNLKQYRKDGAK